jgi:hypothetical protein
MKMQKAMEHGSEPLMSMSWSVQAKQRSGAQVGFTINLIRT